MRPVVGEVDPSEGSLLLVKLSGFGYGFEYHFGNFVQNSLANTVKPGPNLISVPVRAVGPTGASHESVVERLQEDGHGAEDAVSRGQHEGVVYEGSAARTHACGK